MLLQILAGPSTQGRKPKEAEDQGISQVCVITINSRMVAPLCCLRPQAFFWPRKKNDLSFAIVPPVPSPRLPLFSVRHRLTLIGTLLVRPSVCQCKCPFKVSMPWGENRTAYSKHGSAQLGDNCQGLLS